MYLHKLPKQIFELLNNSYDIETLKNWDGMMAAVDRTRFRLAASNSSSDSIAVSQQVVNDTHLTFFNKFSGKSNDLKAPCINKYLGRECTSKPCKYSHDNTNFTKCIKFLSTIIGSAKSTDYKSQRGTYPNSHSEKHSKTSFFIGLAGINLNVFTDYVVLDSGSNTHISNQYNLLNDVRSNSTSITGISSSADVNKCGNMGTIKTVNYVPTSPAIILSQSKLVDDGYSVDFRNNNTYIVSHPDIKEPLLFQLHLGLYMCKKDDFMNFFKIPQPQTCYANILSDNSDSELATTSEFKLSKREVAIVQHFLYI